jgi:hypothetical protein
VGAVRAFLGQRGEGLLENLFKRKALSLDFEAQLVQSLLLFQTSGVVHPILVGGYSYLESVAEELLRSGLHQIGLEERAEKGFILRVGF